MINFEKMSPTFVARVQQVGVLARSTLAAGVLLAAGQAQAAGPNFCPGILPDTATTTTIAGIVTATCLSHGAGTAPDTVPGWFATNQLGSQFTAGVRQDDVVVDFNDGMTGTDMPGLPGGFTGYFYYTITSLENPYIGTIFDMNANQSDVTATKKIWYANPGNPLAPSLPADLTLAWTGSSVTAPISPATTTIWVLDTYNLMTTAPALDNIKNRFYTPGPLPVVGAGVAFSFSRKLRSRIKGSRTV